MFSQSWYEDGTVFRDHYDLAQGKSHKHVGKSGSLPDGRVTYPDEISP